MATRETAQLILEVDARIATAQRAVNQLARSIQQDAAGMDNGLKKIEQSGERVAKSLGAISGRTRSGFTQLSFQIGDVSQQMALGVSGARIFAQQSGQVVQALQIMGGEGNKFLQFLGGPWGLALSTAAVIIAPLASSLFKTGDEVGKLVDKMREQARQAQLNEQAGEAWKTTLDGVEDALRKNRESLDELAKGQKSKARLDLEAALFAKAVLERTIAETEANIGLARSLYEVQKARAAGPGQRGEIASLGLEGKLGSLDALQSQVAKSKADLAEAGKQIEEATSQVLKEVGTSSATDLIAKKYDRLIEKARQRAVAEHKVGDELVRQIAALEGQKQAAIKAANASKTDDRQSGRQVSFAEASQIARAAGLQVNRGFSTTEHQRELFNDPRVNRPGNPVARPGTSAHEGANGKWAIDIQITDGVSPAKIRKVFADQGVSLSKVLKEKGHFHVEGSRSEAASAERRAETEAAKAVRQTNAFEEQGSRLDEELLRAKTQLVQGVDAQADTAIAELQLAQESRKAAIENDVEEGRISQAQAAILGTKIDQITFEKARSIEIQRSVERLQQADELEQRQFQYRADDLRFADEMATTQGEHRRLQLDILDVVYQQKEAHLRALKAELELAGKIEEAATVQAQIDRLGTEKGQDRTRVEKGTMNPLEAWAHDIPKTAAEINEALQSIEARGLDNLANAIGDVITGTRSLKDAFGDLAKSIIADLIKMTIRMLIFRALTAIFGGASSAASGGGSSSIVAGARASGGPVSSGKTYVVGERGPELFVPSGNGMIVPKTPRIDMRGAANTNNREPIELIVHTAPSEDAWARVEIISANTTRNAAPVIVRAAVGETSRQLGRPRLGAR